jgi:hypothetical protein
MAIEESDFTLVSKNDDYEIRQYNPVLVAETNVEDSFEGAGNVAFKILAGYIFGENKSQTKIDMTSPVNQIGQSKSEKIAMTAPVAQTKNQNGFTVQFTMPKKFTLDTLPIPNDSRVKLRQLPARKIAVYTYSGTWSESRYLEKLTEFKNAITKNGITTTNEPVFARYNSPFQIWFLRRNEIWIELQD